MPWYKLLFYIVITYPYFHFILWAMFGSERRTQPQDEAAGYVHTSDKLAKIERAQR